MRYLIDRKPSKRDIVDFGICRILYSDTISIFIDSVEWEKNVEFVVRNIKTALKLLRKVPDCREVDRVLLEFPEMDSLAILGKNQGLQHYEELFGQLRCGKTVEVKALSSGKEYVGQLGLSRLDGNFMSLAIPI